jgi:lipoate-protein ligase A
MKKGGRNRNILLSELLMESSQQRKKQLMQKTYLTKRTKILGRHHRKNKSKQLKMNKQK